MRKIAIFLDRDGVINENRDDYVKSIQEVEFLPNSLEALKKLANLDAYIFIVTNQSAVGRGIITRKDAEEVNKYIVDEVASHGGRIDASFVCIHAPEEECLCRKPKPGLFFESLSQGFRFERAVMVGDSYEDILAAHSLGFPSMLVKTGRGLDTIKSKSFLEDFAVEDLEEAAEEIVAWLNVADELGVVENAASNGNLA